MNLNNMTVRELYASMPSIDDVYGLMKLGILIDNDRLAVSAMEDLIRRKAFPEIIDALEEAIKDYVLTKESGVTSLMMCSLMDNTREDETYLCSYASTILNEDFVGPRTWFFKNPDRHLIKPISDSDPAPDPDQVERLSGGAMVLPGNDR